MIFTGEILLCRKTYNFKAGFCVINKDLSNVLKEISVLHQEEYDHYKTLIVDKRKLSFLLGRIAAKNAVLELLAGETTIKSFSIQFGVFQYPVVKYIQNQNIQVSISHCDNFGVALAFTEEHPLAIDIEKIDENKTDTLKCVICDNEFNKINNCSLSLLLGSTLIWTIKESLSKILKTGLTIDFKILEIESLQKVESVYVSTFVYFTQYKALSKKIGNYMISVVFPKNTTSDLDFFWNVLENSMMENNHNSRKN